MALRRPFPAANDFRDAVPAASIYDDPRLTRGLEMRFAAFVETDRTRIRPSMPDCEITDAVQQRIVPLASGSKRKLNQQSRHLKPGLY